MINSKLRINTYRDNMNFSFPQHIDSSHVDILQRYINSHHEGKVVVWAEIPFNEPTTTNVVLGDSLVIRSKTHSNGISIIEIVCRSVENTSFAKKLLRKINYMSGSINNKNRLNCKNEKLIAAIAELDNFFIECRQGITPRQVESASGC